VVVDILATENVRIQANAALSTDTVEQDLPTVLLTDVSEALVWIATPEEHVVTVIWATTDVLIELSVAVLLAIAEAVMMVALSPFVSEVHATVVLCQLQRAPQQWPFPTTEFVSLPKTASRVQTIAELARHLL